LLSKMVQRLDDGMSTAIQDSILLRPLMLFASKMRGRTAHSVWPKMGKFLQITAFALTALMLAILALPQFANDKEGLALIVAAVTGLFCLGHLMGGPQSESRKPSYIDITVLAFVCANVISTFASHYMIESTKGLAKLAVYALAYFTFTSILSTDNRRRTLLLLSSACLGAFFVSLYGLYQYKIGVAPLATWEDPTLESKGTRIYSTLGNPNLLAGYLIPLIPISMGLTAIALSVKQKGLKALAFIIALGVSLTIACATLLTGCRGAFIALGAMAGTTCLIIAGSIATKKPKLILPTILILLLLGAIGALAIHFLLPSIETRLLSVFSGSEHSSNAYRMNVWRASLKMLQENWWFGVGPGNTTFRLAYGLYMKSGFDALGTYCVPLEIIVEAGIAGLAAFAALLGGLFVQGHLLFWRGDLTARIIGLSLCIALVGLFVHGLVDTVFYRPQIHFLFWMIAACLVRAEIKS